MNRTLLITVVFTLMNSTFLMAQTSDYQLGQAIGNFANQMSILAKESKANKLAIQQEAMTNLKEALKDIEADRINQAKSKAKDAMLTYPRYTLSYLILAYAAFKENDFVSSNRMISLYNRYKRRKENKTLSSNIPNEFIDFIKTQSAEGFSKLSSEELKKYYASESWIKNSLEIAISPSLVAFGDGEVLKNGRPQDPFAPDSYYFPEMGNENNISLVYKKYFWFSREKALPYTNNNTGMSVSMGANFNFNIPDNLLPANYYLFLQPGFFYKKIYFSPLQIRYQRLPDYPEKALTNNVALRITPSMEFRFYPGVINAYGNDALKINRNERSDRTVGAFYYFAKIEVEEFAGIKSMYQEYNRERNSYLVGFTAVAGKRKLTEMSVYLGLSSIRNLRQRFDDANYSGEVDYIRTGITLSRRIF